MILAIDLNLAYFKGNRSNLRLPASMLAGAFSFALALAFHMGLHYAGNHFFATLRSAAIEGAIWGLAAGAGAVWTLTSARQTWLKFFIMCAACGLVLATSDVFLRGLTVAAPFYVVFISGMVMPLFLIGSALVGRSQMQKDE